jgi:hypothetical protein
MNIQTIKAAKLNFAVARRRAGEVDQVDLLPGGSRPTTPTPPVDHKNI